MNKEMIIAKIQCWQADLQEIIATLNDEGKSGPVVDILLKRVDDIDQLIQAIQDTSLICPGDVTFEPEPVLDEIGEKVKKVKQGVAKIKKLANEKRKIIHSLEGD